jgi:mRNA interferase RelE/StbE
VSTAGWRLEVSPTARRALQRLPEKAVGAVAATLDAIARDPCRLGRPLRRELAGRLVARRGSYRVIYEIDDDERLVTILLVGHRADIYRRRRRRLDM